MRVQLGTVPSLFICVHIFVYLVLFDFSLVYPFLVIAAVLCQTWHVSHKNPLDSVPNLRLRGINLHDNYVWFISLLTATKSIILIRQREYNFLSNNIKKTPFKSSHGVSAMISSVIMITGMIKGSFATLWQHFGLVMKNCLNPCYGA